MHVCHVKQVSVLIPALQVNLLMAELAWFLLYTDYTVFPLAVGCRWRERQGSALSPLGSYVRDKMRFDFASPKGRLEETGKCVFSAAMVC